MSPFVGARFARSVRWSFVLILILAAVGTACRSGEKKSEGSGKATITFGASLSLTGDLAAEAKQAKAGYDFMVDLINDKGGIKVGDTTYRVAIKYYDDESDPDTAVKLYDKLITQDKVDFLLGPYSSGVTEAVAPLAEKNKIPMVVAHASATTIYEHGYKYLFGTLNTVDHYSRALLELAAEQTPKPKTLALVNENALFPQLGSDAAAAQAAELGFQVVYKQAYTTGTTDFSSILADVKAKNPDMFIASGYTGDEITITRQADELGLHPKLFGFLLGPTVPGFIDDLGAKANYLLEPIQWAPSMPWKDDLFGLTAQEYADQFEQRFGFVPDYHPPQSSAALEVFYDAIQRAGTLDPAKVRDAIAATDFESFYGPIKFNDKGENVGKEMAVIQVQDGKPVVVFPSDFAKGTLIYPIPSS